MWPMLLNLTRDECRRTLRRLELEAYSNMISVLRAQGALEDNRKKLLEDLRAVLHISSDRHSAEARRVSNDELLATIAHHLAGPNTGLGWISEGRRKVPLLPRGIPQTMYTELADKTAEIIKEENKELLKKLEAEKLVAPKTDEEELQGPEGEAAEGALSSNDLMEEMMYPIAMEDQSSKLWETELINRKRKIPEGGSIPDESMTPVKNMRNIPVNTNQKHLNLSQIYSKYSQPATSKSSGQSKHSYNQVSKVSTSKSSQPHAPRAHKHRSHKTNKNAQALSKQAKKAQAAAASPGKQFPPAAEYAGAPGSFQASYAQAVLGGKPPPEPEPRAPAPAAPPPPPKHAKHPHQFLIKGRRPEPADKKVQTPDVKPLHKTEGIKVLSNRQVVVAGAPPRPAPQDRMIVVSKPVADHKSVNSKIVIASTARTPAKEPPPAAASPVKSEAFTPKGIPATDLKVSAKTFVLNQKPGQKMVVLPAKARTKVGSDVQLPLLHFKGIPTGMKLVPVSSQSLTPVSKSPAVTVASKPATAVSAPAATPKVLGIETIRTANLADIVPVKGLTPVPAARIASPIVRPASAKGSVIVVQKGATIGKALSFTKNGNDMSKIIMGKNVNQLLQASKPEQEAGAGAGVIVLELNNDQAGRATTMSEILDARAPPDDDDKSLGKDDAKDSSSATDWEMELDTVSRKGKDEEDKLNSLHLDLGMSSDSDVEFSADERKAKRAQDAARRDTPTGDRGEYSSALSLATRTLLSQLQDEGSSSGDSFALKAKKSAESAALCEAKEKLSEKVADARSRHKRIDVFSTAISSADINLDFAILDDALLAGDAPDPAADALALDKH